MIMPVALSDFEAYMLGDDTPAYPMTIVARVHLEGDLDRELLDESLRTTVAQHPLLRARIRRTWWGARRWECSSQDFVSPRVAWNSQSDATQPAIFDLTREFGLRAFGNTSGTLSTLTFQFHHACCDGIGALRLIGQTLAHYGCRTTTGNGERPVLEVNAHATLALRGRLCDADRDEHCRAARRSSTVVEKLTKMLGRRIHVLASPSPAAHATPTPSPFHDCVVQRLDRDICRGLRSAAAGWNCTVNDLYLRELFLTLRDWSRTHGVLSEREWIRIGMPVDMRTPAHDALPACNRVSYVFLSRQPAGLERERELLEFIRDRTAGAINRRYGNWFLKGLRYVRLVPGLLPLLLRRRTRFATAIASNLGDPRKHFGARFPVHGGLCVIGNLRLVGIDGVTPLRAGTRATMTYGTYGGGLTLSLKCDPNTFTEDDAQRFLSAYAQRLTRLSNAESSASSIPRAA